jgi:hypothetical protein
MFFTKLRIVVVTLIAIVTTATGVGVLARQLVAPAPALAQGEDRAGPESSNPVPAEDDPSVRAESLRPDIELLSIDVSTLKELIIALTHEIASREAISLEAILRAPEQDGLARDVQLERMRQRMADLRSEFLTKSKELGQKRLDLELLERRVHQRLEQQHAASLPRAADTPPSPTSLEQRLRDMERKLDQILKALQRSKQDQ